MAWRRYRYPLKKDRNKFGAIRTEFGGQVYASKLEARCAEELWWRQQAGEITKIETQVPFELVPRPNRITYVADFVITLKDGTKQVYEAKGAETTVWKIKEKLFHHAYPDIRLVVWKG